jgi:hypothetical protein
MAQDSADLRRRHWADVVGIIAGVWAFGEAIWGPTIFTDNVQDRGATATWLAYGLGGLLAVLGVVLAQRHRTAGRVLVACGGVLHLASPFAYANPATLPIVSAVVIGVMMLVAAPFVGPMPRDLPHAEGRATSGRR